MSAVKFRDRVAYGFDLLVRELRRGGQPQALLPDELRDRMVSDTLIGLLPVDGRIHDPRTDSHFFEVLL